MDVRMPGIDGIEATRRLVTTCPDSRILILTTFQYDEYVWGALRAGASGFLLKRSSPERLIDAVRTVAAGEALLDPAITRDLDPPLSAARDSASPAPPSHATLARLTERERQVLSLIGRGPLQPGDRRPARDRGIDRQDARQADPRQDRRPRPRPGRRLRLPQRAGQAERRSLRPDAIEPVTTDMPTMNRTDARHVRTRPALLRWSRVLSWLLPLRVVRPARLRG